MIDFIFSIIGGIYVFDFLIFGLFKCIFYFLKLYLFIYWVMSWLIFFFLYWKIYYGFVSNYVKWKFVLAIFIFLSVMVLFYSGFRLKNNLVDVFVLCFLDMVE